MRSILYSCLLVASAACAAAPREDAAPVPATPPAAAASADTGRNYTASDLAFVRGMIGHHAQALEMTALVDARASRADLRLLAERIEVSQQDEIATMQGWLRERGEAAPGHHHGGGDHALMPGMLTAEEMASLHAATGPAFDRRFLELMIRHHEGAVRMVEELFAAGGGRDSQLYQLAADVDGDQRAEIERMRRLLNPQ